jgi:hypothetical protein
LLESQDSVNDARLKEMKEFEGEKESVVNLYKLLLIVFIEMMEE